MYTIMYQLIFLSIPDNAWFDEEILPSTKQIFTNFKPPFSDNKSWQQKI